MKTRKQLIEEIISSMHAVRQQILSLWLSSKTYNDKPAESHITSSQWMVLVTVMKNKDINITNLATSQGISTSAATQLVDQLVEKGYLLRAANSEDRRILSLSLTKKAEKNINEMRSKRAIIFKGIFDNLTDKELEQFASLNKKIADNLLKK